MRDMDARLGGEPITLAVTWGASEQIAKKVADPLVIWREAKVENLALGSGAFSHQPKFRFTAENVAQIIHIGAKAAGSSITLSDVQDRMIADGLGKAQIVAEEYIGMFIAARSEEVTDVEAKSASGE